MKLVTYSNLKKKLITINFIIIYLLFNFIEYILFSLWIEIEHFFFIIMKVHAFAYIILT